ncbi:putative ubiquitin-like-specific protease 1B [Tasmannia lanceolata]|uniref:putative ubiquitin-like-specific protease 1B n=1 Tax=Tasmannia lanceolata TaxID=3420 RepID=UPI0040635014
MDETTDEKTKLKYYELAKGILNARLIDIPCEEINMVLIPLCQNNHWVLLVLDMVKKSFFECNSSKELKFDELARHTVALIKEYFKSHGCDIYHFPYAQVADFPQQDNGFDCGVFVIKGIEHMYSGIAFNFGRDDIPQIRLELCERFIRGEFGKCELQ